MKKSILIPSLALVCIFGGAMLGMQLRAALLDQLSPETKDSVRLGMGLVATMTALLLGLLVASAKGSYDAQRKEVIHLAGKLDFLDRLLEEFYGPGAAEVRATLRGLIGSLVQQLWPDKEARKAKTDYVFSPFRALFDSISRLVPENDLQGAARAEALETTADLSKTRWLLYAMRDTSIATPMLVIVIFWLTTIFISFGLFAPMNWTAIGSMFTAALSVSSAIFLIMELDRPFDGVIHISDAPLRNTLNRPGA